MIVLDRMLVGGIRFVLGKIAAAVESELDDEDRLRERLLEAQMRLEVGEITAEELAATEKAILARLREIKAARGGAQGLAVNPADYRVTGVEATFGGDEDDR